MRRREFIASGVAAMFSGGLLRKLCEKPRTWWAKGKTVMLRWPPRPRLYWVAKEGHWDDPQSWAGTPNGRGGAGMPSDQTDVYMRPKEGERFVVSCQTIPIKPAKNIFFGGDGDVEFDAVMSDQFLAVGEAVLEQGRNIVHLTSKPADGTWEHDTSGISLESWAKVLAEIT